MKDYLKLYMLPQYSYITAYRNQKLNFLVKKNNNKKKTTFKKVLIPKFTFLTLVSVAVVPIGWVDPPSLLSLWFTLFSVLHLLFERLTKN